MREEGEKSEKLLVRDFLRTHGAHLSLNVFVA